MSGRLDGKIAVITGAGSGMGRAIANRFAEEGAAVAALDISPAAVRNTVASIVAAGGKANAYVTDITDADAIAKTIAAINTDLGTVTTLVNNAGIFDDHKPLLDTDEALWDRVLQVDLKSIYLMTRALLPQMQQTGNAAIINTSSIAGVVAHGGGLAYTAAKHGVLGITKSVAADYGPAVRCNAILPGAVLTPMTEEVFSDSGNAATRDAIAGSPAGRFAYPEEIANVVVFLASDESSFMYGAQVAVDGGWTAL